MDYADLTEVITYLPKVEVQVYKRDGRYEHGVWKPSQSVLRFDGYVKGVSDRKLMMDQSGTFNANDVLCYVLTDEKFRESDTPAVLQERDTVMIQGVSYVVVGVQQYDPFGFRRYHLRRETAEIASEL